MPAVFVFTVCCLTREGSLWASELRISTNMLWFKCDLDKKIVNQKFDPTGIRMTSGPLDPEEFNSGP